MVLRPGGELFFAPRGELFFTPLLIVYHYAISMSSAENTFDFCVFCTKYLFGAGIKYCYQYVNSKIACGARCERMGGAPPLSVTHRRRSKLSRARRARSVLPLTACAGCGTRCPSSGVPEWAPIARASPCEQGAMKGDRPARYKPRGTEPAKLHQIQIWRYFITFPEIAPN